MKMLEETFSQRAVKIPGLIPNTESRAQEKMTSDGPSSSVSCRTKVSPEKEGCLDGGWLWKSCCGQMKWAWLKVEPGAWRQGGTHVWVCADLGVLLQHSTVWGQRAPARRWALGASLKNVTERNAET